MKQTQYFIEVLALLEESKREHVHCEDVWYCCRECRHPDHMLIEGEHLGDSIVFGVTFESGVCSCGAAEWNNKVNAMLHKFEVRVDA